MRKDEEKKRIFTWRNMITLFVLLSMSGSIVYAVINIVTASPGAIPATEHGRLRSDYVLALVQCVLGVVVMFLPSFVSRKFKFEIADWVYLTYILFLYCAIYLGEVANFYNRLEHWDTLLHLASGAMLGALGFYVVNFLNKSQNVRVNLSPSFVALFAFCFALSLGAIWEMYEFAFDGFLGLNMQKHSLESGTELVGRFALNDTMKDLFVGALGALVVTICEYFFIKNGRLFRHKKDVGEDGPNITI